MASTPSRSYSPPVDFLFFHFVSLRPFFCPFSTRSFLCISFLRDPALAPLPPLRLNNYPPFDDFALLLSYHILHMQIFIDQKNSEIKRFIRSLHVSPSFTTERERESI